MIAALAAPLPEGDDPVTTPSKASRRMTHDAQNPAQDAPNPAPAPDGTTQALSGAQTGGLGDALRALSVEIASAVGNNLGWSPDLRTYADQADRLERERDEACAQVERVADLVRYTECEATVHVMVDGEGDLGPCDRTAIAWALGDDEDARPWPVCVRHVHDRHLLALSAVRAVLDPEAGR